MSEYSFLLKILRNAALNLTDSGATGGKIITGVDIKIIYGANKRPLQFEVSWKEDGVQTLKIIDNY